MDSNITINCNKDKGDVQGSGYVCDKDGCNYQIVEVRTKKIYKDNTCDGECKVVPTPTSPVSPPSSYSSKIIWITVLIIVVIAVISLGAYWIYARNKSLKKGGTSTSVKSLF